MEFQYYLKPNENLRDLNFSFYFRKIELFSYIISDFLYQENIIYRIFNK